MKLATTIPPRRDGTVLVTPPGGGAKITFAPQADGLLVAEVADEAVLAWLLANGDFLPASEDDEPMAEAILSAAVADEADDDHGGDDEDGDDDDGPPPDVPPVEAMTPPSARKPRKAKA